MTVGILPNVNFYWSESGCKFGNKGSFPHKKVEEQPDKMLKKGGDENAVAKLKDVRQLGCVFQDTEPPEPLSILRKSTKVLGSIRRVRFTEATQRRANIREKKGPSLGTIQVKIAHQRSLYLMVDLRQERCARGGVEYGQEYL